MYTLNISLSGADIYYGQSIHQEDWDRFSEEEKISGLNSAVQSFQINANKTIQQIADYYNTDDVVYNFNTAIYTQARLILEEAERYRDINGPLSIMQIADEKPFTLNKTKPISFIYPETLSHLGIIYSGPICGRA